jgi:hypothetical protein
MKLTTLRATTALLCVCMLAACSGDRPRGSALDPDDLLSENHPERLETENTIWDIFNRKSNENQVLVNRYLWAASLEVLDFLPMQSVDPYTGVIVTGYGTPPGGSRAYRATVLIDDPALEARALNVALQTRNGPVSGATARAGENSILNRARGKCALQINAFKDSAI